jgi:tetratricopeptide (TPR) repeat protein
VLRGVDLLDKSIKHFCVLTQREAVKSLVDGALEELKYADQKTFYSDLSLLKATLALEGRKAIVVDSLFTWPGGSLQGGLFSIREATFGTECFSILCTAQIDKQLLAAAMEHNVSKVLLEKQTSSSMFAFQLQALSDAMVNPKPFQKMILSLEKAMLKNDLLEVEKYANQVFMYFPEQPRGRLEYAEQCLRSEKYDETDRISSGLLKEQPLFLSAVNTLAKLKLAQAKYNEGVKLLLDAEIISKGSPIRLTLLGDLYYKLGNKPQSEACYQVALEWLPNHKPALIGLAKLQMTEDPTLKIVRKHHMVLGDEDTARALNLAAVELVRKGEVKKSIELYTICIEIIANPIKKNRVHFNLALALIRAGEMKQAETALQDILKIEPSFEKAKETLKKIAS